MQHYVVNGTLVVRLRARTLGWLGFGLSERGRELTYNSKGSTAGGS